jgi:hypothetical protein
MMSARRDTEEFKRDAVSQITQSHPHTPKRTSSVSTSVFSVVRSPGVN